jgi:hypothetical protein
MPVDTQLRVSPDVVAQDLGDGLVLLNLRTGIYWGLNRTGAVIWRGIENRSGIERICRRLQAEFAGSADELAAAVHSLLSELAAERLIVEAVSSGLGAPETAQGTSQRSRQSRKTAAAKSARKKIQK